MAETLPTASITVRMYRGILGDCFLLTYVQDGAPTKILIDCGVLQHVEGGEAKIRAIAADVRAEVNGDLDLLVLTHEHYDHLSGFALAQDVFFTDAFNVKALWLAWTENRADDQAKELRKRFKQARTALALTARVADKLGLDDSKPGADPSEQERYRSLRLAKELAAFIGPVEGLAAAGSMTGAQVIEEFQRKVRPEGIKFLEPGQLVWVTSEPKSSDPNETRPTGSGLRAYVLGPPRSDKLRKDKPSGGERKEVYLAALDEAKAVESAARAKLARFGMNAAEAGGDSIAPDGDDASPFALPHRRSVEAAERTADALLAEPAKAPGASDDPRVLYFRGADADARKIDDEWTAAAGSLALKMDSDTNNTSLALAFELPDRQILLFPGDAQVGNWLSWHDQTYPADDPTVAPLSAGDLLRRVTLYKVGHHGSHNATLREAGLERMTDKQRLVAMIPVVREVAKDQGREGSGGWKMPYPELYDELERRTQGRILCGDGDPGAEQAVFAKRPTDKNHPARLTYADDSDDPLWVEVTITSGPAVAPDGRGGAQGEPPA